MTRTAAREMAIQISFQVGVNPLGMDEILDVFFEPEYYAGLEEEDTLFSEYPDEKQLSYIRRLAIGVSAHLPELDSYIEKYSRKWKVSRISRTAVAIMRVCMFEALYMPDVPNAAAINEAVELGKRYEDQETVSFINGILGSFIKGEVEL